MNSLHNFYLFLFIWTLNIIWTHLIILTCCFPITVGRHESAHSSVTLGDFQNSVYIRTQVPKISDSPWQKPQAPFALSAMSEGLKKIFNGNTMAGRANVSERKRGRGRERDSEMRADNLLSISTIDRSPRLRTPHWRSFTWSIVWVASRLRLHQKRK